MEKLMKNKINALIGLFVFVCITMACNASFTTANISSFTTGKNEKAEPATTTFNVGDKVHGLAVVSNSMSKSKVNFKLFFENVQGQKKGEVAGTTDVEMASSGTATFSFNAVAPGDYKIDATLIDESGKEIDKKSATVTVKGAAPTTSTDKPKSDDTSKDDEKPESN